MLYGEENLIVSDFEYEWGFWLFGEYLQKEERKAMSKREEERETERWDLDCFFFCCTLLIQQSYIFVCSLLNASLKHEHTCLCVSDESSLLLVHPHVYSQMHACVSKMQPKLQSSKTELHWGCSDTNTHTYAQVPTLTQTHTHPPTHIYSHRKYIYSVVLNQQEGNYRHSHWG